MSSRQQHIKSLFMSVIDMDSAAEREAYLDDHCAGDEQVRAEVMELLGLGPQVGSFLEGQTNDPVATPDVPSKDLESQAIGPFKIREQLGEGGMGAVYVAEQTEPVRRKVALKIIKPGMDSQAGDRPL